MENLEYPHMDRSQIEALLEEAIMVIEGSTPERAVQMLEDAMAAMAFDLSAGDESMIEVRMYLGRAFWMSDVPERAVPVLRAAWADAVRVTGPESRLSFSCAGNLCRALGKMHLFEEALEIAGDLYARRVAEFGELDNGTLNSLGHISQLLYEAGAWDEAVETMEELLQLRTDAFGADDPRTESSRYNLSVMVARLTDDVKKLSGSTMRRYVKMFGEESSPVIGLHAQIAAVHERNGDLEAALREWQHVERMRIDLHGEVAIPTLTATARKLWVIWQLGDSRVENQLRLVGATIARIAGPDHPVAKWCADAHVSL